MCAAQNGLKGWDLDRHVFDISWGRRLDPPVLEHAVLKQFCKLLNCSCFVNGSYPAPYFVFFSLELYNVTDFSPGTYQLCQEYLAEP